MQKKYLLITLAVSATANSVTFDDQPLLKGKKIHSIVVQDSTDTPKVPGGASVVSTAGVRDCFLTLVNVGNEAVIDRLNLSNLQPKNRNGREIQQSLENINWNSSRVEFSQNGNLAAGQVIPFTVCYIC